MSNWSQSICADCWNERNPNRIAHVVVEGLAPTEVCCYCEKLTGDGIYLRVDPSTVPFPQGDPSFSLPDVQGHPVGSAKHQSLIESGEIL